MVSNIFLKANWPENGLQLAEVFFTAEKPDKLGLTSSWSWSSLVWYEKEIFSNNTFDSLPSKPPGKPNLKIFNLY